MVDLLLAATQDSFTISFFRAMNFRYALAEWIQGCTSWLHKQNIYAGPEVWWERWKADLHEHN